MLYAIAAYPYFVCKASMNNTSRDTKVLKGLWTTTHHTWLFSLRFVTGTTGTGVSKHTPRILASVLPTRDNCPLLPSPSHCGSLIILVGASPLTYDLLQAHSRLVHFITTAYFVLIPMIF